MSPKIYHKKKSEMRGEQPKYYLHPNACNVSNACNVPNACSVPNACNRTTCNVPIINTTNTVNMAHSILNCRYAPYYCFNYRNVSLWCEYCMSRRMFPEHYSHDPRFFTNNPPLCSDLYINGQYVMPPSISCTVPQPCVPHCTVPQTCPVICEQTQQQNTQTCPAFNTNM